MSYLFINVISSGLVHLINLLVQCASVYDMYVCLMFIDSRFVHFY